MNAASDLSHQTLRVKVATYWVFSKPRIWMVFALEGLAGSLLAWSDSRAFPWFSVAAGVVTIALAAAGAEALTNVLDRSMDSVMPRTRSRPLPRGMMA